MGVANVITITHRPDELDENAIAYPSGDWTYNDYLNAGRSLTEYDGSGEVVEAGVAMIPDPMNLMGFYGQSLVNSDSYPVQIDINRPEIQAYTQAWVDYRRESVPDNYTYDFDNMAIFIGGLYSAFGQNSDATEIAQFPNQRGVVEPEGYAVSAGTANPELAYELIQYMSRTPEIAFKSIGISPARQSILGEATEDGFYMLDRLPQEAQNTVAQSIANAHNPADAFYFHLVLQAMRLVENEGLTVEQALSQAQQTYSEVQIAVETIATQSPMMAVASLAPEPELAAGEIALTLAVETVRMPMPNQDVWEDTIATFTDQDSQIGHIDFITRFPSSNATDEADCYVSPNNMLFQIDTNTLYSVNPFLNTEASLAANNLLPGTLEALTSGGQVWGIPLSLQPYVMWYEPQAFQNANVPAPRNDWTIDQFEDALRQLYAQTNEPVYRVEGNGNDYLQLLFVAYGAELIDDSTNPPSYRLTEPTNIEAIRSVLNLARDGYIEYLPLRPQIQPNAEYDGVMYNYALSTDRQSAGLEGNINDVPVMFPRGVNDIPLQYNLSVGHINRSSQYPEACFRLLSHIAQQPRLLNGLPVQRNLLPEFSEALSADANTQAVFEAFAAALQSPNYTVVEAFNNSSSVQTNISQWVAEYFLHRAFDRYVLENAILEDELELSQTNIQEFNKCSASIVAPDVALSDLTQEQSFAYYNQFLDCVIAIDPSASQYVRPTN